MDKLLASHIQELEERFENRNYNIGWFQDDKSICTKIYGRGDKQAQVLTSTINKQNKINHKIEDY